VCYVRCAKCVPGSAFPAPKPAAPATPVQASIAG